MKRARLISKNTLLMLEMLERGAGFQSIAKTMGVKEKTARDYWSRIRARTMTIEATRGNLWAKERAAIRNKRKQDDERERFLPSWLIPEKNSG